MALPSQKILEEKAIVGWNRHSFLSSFYFFLLSAFPGASEWSLRVRNTGGSGDGPILL